MALGVQVGAVPAVPEPAGVSGASVGSAGGAEPGQGTGWEHRAVLLAWRQGSCFEAIRLFCCWKIKGSCKQSGRAFTFTLVFPVWSMPKCRTWKSADGEGEMCTYSIKSRPGRDICDVNSSMTVLVYHGPLDWFVLAELCSKSLLPMALLLVRGEPEQDPCALLLQWCFHPVGD